MDDALALAALAIGREIPFVGSRASLHADLAEQTILEAINNEQVTNFALNNSDGSETST